MPDKAAVLVLSSDGDCVCHIKSIPSSIQPSRGQGSSVGLVIERGGWRGVYLPLLQLKKLIVATDSRALIEMKRNVKCLTNICLNSLRHAGATLQ